MKLYSGMFAKVFISMGETNRIIIPKSVLVEKGQLIGIYTLSQSGTALLRWIRVGKTYGRFNRSAFRLKLRREIYCIL